MKKKYHFLRFVVVLLKIVAVLLLIASVAGAIFAFAPSVRNTGGQSLPGWLVWASFAGGILALIGGLFSFIVFWSLADLIRVKLAIEANTREVALRLDDLKARLSAAEIGAAAAEGIAKALEAREARAEHRVVAGKPVVEVAEVAPPEAVAEKVSPRSDEALLRAKQILDKSLEEAARQMAELEGRAPSEGVESAGDDLVQIVGIGPVFAARLRQAGLTTFAQVAAATPEELAAITEQSVDRVVRDDWIGQAKRLAAG